LTCLVGLNPSNVIFLFREVDWFFTYLNRSLTFNGDPLEDRASKKKKEKDHVKLEENVNEFVTGEVPDVGVFINIWLLRGLVCFSFIMLLLLAFLTMVTHERLNYLHVEKHTEVAVAVIFSFIYLTHGIIYTVTFVAQGTKVSLQMKNSEEERMEELNEVSFGARDT
ncbi:hypothetical protein ACJX0J_015725, partial [Zea mays]